MGIIDLTFGPGFLSDDRAARLANAEAVAARAISFAPNHPMAHLLSGVIKIFTNRGVQGIAECDRALVLDRNLADAHAWIGLGKYFIARAMDTEAHILEALRLSPRDIFAFRWMWIAGLARFHRHADAEAAAWMRRRSRQTPISPSGISFSARSWRSSAAPARRRPPRKRDWRSRQVLPSSASLRADRVTIRSTSPRACASVTGSAWPVCPKLNVTGRHDTDRDRSGSASRLPDRRTKAHRIVARENLRFISSPVS